ncbi:MAG: hypothetical protein ACTSW3_05635 [Promethearchaeota archaeon]
MKTKFVKFSTGKIVEKVFENEEIYLRVINNRFLTSMCEDEKKYMIRTRNLFEAIKDDIIRKDVKKVNIEREENLITVEVDEIIIIIFNPLAEEIELVNEISNLKGGN